MTSAEMEEAVRLAKECLHAGGADYNECDLSQLARCVLALMDRCERMRDDIERVVPYVLATLPYPNGTERSNVACSSTDWVAVHRGRGASSSRQLEQLLASTRTSEKEGGE